ncbi:hypothetical protein IID23_04140 [Patescibacteria group bacterium]|nr:hypothetical protein [Patescibacteria group bacterium]
MTKKTQVDKNIDLSEKLADYLVESPSEVKKIRSNATYIPLSATDKELNKLNSKLVSDATKEGKKVVIAEETGIKDKPWVFKVATS